MVSFRYSLPRKRRWLVSPAWAVEVVAAADCNEAVVVWVVVVDVVESNKEFEEVVDEGNWMWERIAWMDFDVPCMKN